MEHPHLKTPEGIDNVQIRSAIVIAALAFTTFGTAPAMADDMVATKKLYKKECRSCHGPTGKGLASYPKLAGHTAEYIADKLTRYRAGEKFGPNTPLMAPRAKKLSDEDIANIAAFIGTEFQ